MMTKIRKTEIEKNQLMVFFDRINRTFGEGTLCFSSQGTEQQRRGASNYCNPNYTLNFSELPAAKAK